MGGADQYRCNAVRIHQRRKLPVPRAGGRIPRHSPPRGGDTIIVLEVSRLARSTQQLCEIIERVWDKRLWLVIVGSITLDCREGKDGPMSEAFLQMAGVFSQLELGMIRSRVRSGTANAKAKGKQIGRPQISADSIPAIFLRHYPAYKSGQLNILELARICD